MLLKVVIILLPMLCDCTIKINITVASNKDEAIVQYTGQDNRLINNNMVKLFNISMDNLNRGFRVELGKVPDGIFLKDPTTYGNLFHKYKWPELRRNLQIDKIVITEIINKEINIRTSVHENNSTDNIETVKSLYDIVENNVYSTWSEGGMPDEDTFYNVTINCGGNSFKYQNKWRNSSLKNKFVQFGKSVKGHLTIKPGQTIVKKLLATKTIFVLKIDYRAKLVGNLIGDYENLYGKYHFWAPTIDNIMRAGNISNEVKTSERMEIRCYTDPKLEILDKDTGLVVPLRVKRRLLWKFKPQKWMPPMPTTTVVSSTTQKSTENNCTHLFNKLIRNRSRQLNSSFATVYDEFDG